MLVLLIYSAFLGWCGTPWPGWWRHILRPPRPVPPEPDPPYRKATSDPMPGIAALVGGMAGGYLIHTLMPAEGLAATGLAAFAVGRVFSDIASGLKSGMK